MIKQQKLLVIKHQQLFFKKKKKKNHKMVTADHQTLWETCLSLRPRVLAQITCPGAECGWTAASVCGPRFTGEVLTQCGVQREGSWEVFILQQFRVSVAEGQSTSI